MLMIITRVNPPSNKRKLNLAPSNTGIEQTAYKANENTKSHEFAESIARKYKSGIINNEMLIKDLLQNNVEYISPPKDNPNF